MKRKISLIIILLCLVSGYGQNSTTQFSPIEDELTFHALDVELGVNSIEQDSLGFIWIGTPGGLFRYDGTEFITYGKDKEIAPNRNLSNNFIRQLRLIDKGRLAITTYEGLNIFDPRKESFELVNEKNGLLSDNISRFEYGDNGEFILGVDSVGVQILYPDKKITLYSNNPHDYESLFSDDIISMVRQDDSLLWVGSKNNGLNKINLKKKKVTRVSLEGAKKSSVLQIDALYTCSDNNLWIGSNNGLYVITATSDTLHMQKSDFEGKGLSDNNILCFQEDNLGQIWMGTRNGGLSILDKQSFLQKKPDLRVKWYLPEDDGTSVSNRSVTALKKDWDGNMWIGTGIGLMFVKPDGEPVKLLRKNNATSESLGHDRVSALEERFDGKIWIGTDGSGLDLFDPMTGLFEHYKNVPYNSSSISNDYILALHEDKNRRLWIGTYLGGLNKMSPETGRCTHYLQGNPDQGSDVRVVFEDGKEQIWVGTNRGGLFKYNEELDKFEFISSLGKLDIRDIKEDLNGFLWMATYGDGLLKYNPKTNESIFYNTTNINDFPSDNVLGILLLSNGSLLAGTENGGLVKFNDSTKDIVVFKERDGLSNHSIASIVMENQKSIWLGTYRGISHYNAETGHIYNLNTYTNIQRGMFRCGLITKSGAIYFGGDKGLNIFHSEKFETKKEAHPIVFKKLEVLDKKIQVSENDDNTILGSSILYEDHISLNHNENFLSLDYVVLKYPYLKDVVYSYWVDGYNDYWVSTNESGKVNLLNIPHGDYTLNVKAQLGSGEEVTKRLLLTVNPPFWKTTIAYICYLLFFVAALYWFMKYYTERIKLINSLEFEKKQRQLEYNFNEERMRFFTSFSHELKTPLTLILAPLEDLLAEIKSIKHKNSLNLIQKNAKQLLQTINKLLEFRKSNLGLSKLRIEEHNLTECLDQWIHNYFPLARKRGMALSYDFPEEDLFAWFDLEKMHIIFNNLLSNAFKYTKDNGEIHVSLSYDEESFEIKVKDTGYGMEKEELEHVFERYYQASSVKSKEGIGIGLALSKNFAELHMGTINIESEKNKGSVFSVVIPRDKSLFVDAILDVKDTDKVNETVIADEWVASSEVKSSEDITSNINIDKEKELVLLVDDNPDILNYLDGLLEGKYDLIYAKDGEEGVEKALRYVPDLIVSDVMMPKLSGIQLCNALKETIETTHIPIILLTAKGNTESIEEGYKHGADDYIIKPFSGKILQTRIRNLLDTRKKLRNYFLKNEDAQLDAINGNSTLLEQEKDFLNKLEGVILNHLDEEKLDVWVVSQDIGMSRTSLYRKIKAITGLNINQYIRKVKMDKAAELLKTGNYTIAQASYEVGFSNVKYFRKLFKEQFEKLPSDLTKNKMY
ncbi:two-component regulator propeller domain-containing protein [Flavobacteriaceae bacterium SZ-1-7]|uniref:two-component regulator propeller domain-containing protein n=1 Tax=Tamlana sedimenti TaxID=3134126 RepID=UPI003120E026